jgi:HSP20 family protein
MTLIRRNFPNLEDFAPTVKFFDDAFDRFFNEPAALRPWSPAVDIAENENELVLTADLPGVKKDQVKVRIENGSLVLSGERKFEAEDKDKKTGYHRLERSYGSFKRIFQLPETVDAEKVSAAYEDGVLRITLAKKEIAKPRTIDIALKS